MAKRAEEAEEDVTTCCVRLGDAQVLVTLNQDQYPLQKFAMFIKEGKNIRKLTRDEEMAYAAAPCTAAERDAAAARLGTFKEVQAVLKPRPWRDGEIELVVAQIERNNLKSGSTNTNELH